MNRAHHIALKQTLWAKIKRLAALCGECSGVDTQEYAKSIYEANLEDLQGAIDCFTSLIDQAIRLGRKCHVDTEVQYTQGIPRTTRSG